MRLKSEAGRKKREAGIKNVVRNEKLEAGMESFVFLPAPCFTFASCFLLSWSYILTAITNPHRLGARTMENSNSFDWLLVIKDIAWFAPMRRFTAPLRMPSVRQGIFLHSQHSPWPGPCCCPITGLSLAHRKTSFCPTFKVCSWCSRAVRFDARPISSGQKTSTWKFGVLTDGH